MQNTTQNTIAIIGAGAAGLMAAITASKTGQKVHLYEQNTKPAKKILASGNGRCNIANTHVSSNDYAGLNTDFSSYCLEHFNFNSLQKFCKSMGLHLNILECHTSYNLFLY